MNNDLIPVNDLKEMASALSHGNLFGKTKEQIFPLLLIAQAEGKHPAIAVQEYDIIKGKPALTSRATLSRFQAAGGKIQYICRDDTECTIKFMHPSGGELTVTWTTERAKKAGLGTGDAWRKYPAQMLSARCVAEGVRALYPACLNSLYTVEEHQDLQTVVYDIPEELEPKVVDVTPKDIPAPCQELITLQKYLDTDKVPNKEVTINKEKTNLLEKTKGAIKHLQSLTEFNSETKGYKTIKQIIKLIEESQELDVSMEADKVTEDQELDIF